MRRGRWRAPPLPAAPHDIPAPRGLLEGGGATPPDAPEGPCLERFNIRRARRQLLTVEVLYHWILLRECWGWWNNPWKELD